MFFIFGVRKSRIGTQVCSSACSYCQQKDTLALIAYQNYFHVFWIPLFPLWKEVHSVCVHCKQQRRMSEFSPEMKLEGVELRKRSKTPFFTYALPACFLLFFIISAIVHSIK